MEIIEVTCLNSCESGTKSFTSTAFSNSLLVHFLLLNVQCYEEVKFSYKVNGH